MLYNKAMRNLPFDRVVPYSNDEIMVISSEKFAFKLSKIMDDDGKLFSIREIMEGKKEVFGSEDFIERCRIFSEILDTRLERFFDTKKASYLFFDLEEQNQLKEIFDAVAFNCRVNIFMLEDGEHKKVKLEDMTIKDSRTCMRLMNELNIRVLLSVDEHFKLSKASKEESEKARKKFEEMKKKMGKDIMSTFFERYPKLSGFKTQAEVKKYYRRLTVKYHPDKEGGDNDTFVIINTDFEKIFKEKWFNNLPAK